MKVNALSVAIEDILNQLRIPSILELAPNGVTIAGDVLRPVQILVVNQDNQGGPTSNLNGEELISTVYVNVLAVLPPGDMELGTSIDNLVRLQLLRTGIYPVRQNSKGRVYSIVLEGIRSYVGPGLENVGTYLYHGGYYKVRAEGNEL